MEEVACIGIGLFMRNLLSDRMQKLFLKYTMLSSKIDWKNLGDLTEIMVSTSCTEHRLHRH